MRRTTITLLAVLLAVAGVATAQSVYPPIRGYSAGASVSSSATPPAVCGADSVAYDNDGVLGCVKLTDVAPQPLTLRPQPAYAQGTQTAGNLVIAGGMDEKKVTIDNATCNAGDTVTVYINNAGSLGTNVLTYGTEWCSSGCGTAALKATSLASAVDALTGVSSIAVSDVAYVTADVLTVVDVYFSESDPTCTTYSNGTNGTVRMPANQVVEWNGRLQLSSTSDGKLLATNNAGTAGACWDYATDSTARLYGRDCSTLATLYGQTWYSQRSSTVGTILQTNSSSQGELALNNTGKIWWGDGNIGSASVGFSKTAAGVVQVNTGTAGAGAAVEFFEQTAPAAGAANSARLYAVDNGGGKTQLCVIFSSGAAQCFATQP